MENNLNHEHVMAEQPIELKQVISEIIAHIRLLPEASVNALFTARIFSKRAKRATFDAQIPKVTNKMAKDEFYQLLS